MSLNKFFVILFMSFLCICININPSKAASEVKLAVEDELSAAIKQARRPMMHQSALTRILAIDGGGVRGAFPAAILQKMETDMQKEDEKAGKPVEKRRCIYDVFQGGITGTSTGSFIALGLVAPAHRNKDGIWAPGPYSAEEIVDIYRTLAPEIFQCWTLQNCWENAGECCDSWASCIRNLFCFGCFACCYNCGGFCGPRYSNANLRRKLEYLFGEMTLGQALVPVQIVACDTGEAGEPINFTDRFHGKMKMRDAALASSAAPTYFPGVEVPDGNGSLLGCVDGGLVENSASISALSYAKTIMPISEHNDDFVLLSLGTGTLVSPSMFNEVRRGGNLGWAKRAINVSISGVSKAADRNLGALLEGIDGDKKVGSAQIKGVKIPKYFRVQVHLNEAEFGLDDPKIIKTLINKGLGFHDKNKGLQDFKKYHLAHSSDFTVDLLAHAVADISSKDEGKQKSAAEKGDKEDKKDGKEGGGSLSLQAPLPGAAGSQSAVTVATLPVS